MIMIYLYNSLQLNNIKATFYWLPDIGPPELEADVPHAEKVYLFKEKVRNAMLQVLKEKAKHPVEDLAFPKDYETESLPKKQQVIALLR